MATTTSVMPSCTSPRRDRQADPQTPNPALTARRAGRSGKSGRQHFDLDHLHDAQTLSEVRSARYGCATKGATRAPNRLETPAKRCFEMLFVAARELQAGPVVQDDHVLAAEIGLQLLDPLDVYDGRPVDAHEPRGVELRFEMLHGFAQRVPGAARMDLDVVALRFDPVDVLDAEDGHATARLDRETLQVLTVAGDRRLPRDSVQQGGEPVAQRSDLALAHLLLGVRHRPAESLVVEGLEQIEQRVDLERPEGVLVVGGDEDHHRELRRVEPTEQREAVHLGHLDVEEQQVGRRAPDGVECRAAVGAFSHDVNLGVVGEQRADGGARGRLVVHHEGPDPLGHVSPCHSACARRNGSTIRASRPPSGALPTSSSQSAPYSRVSRARVFDNPIPGRAAVTPPSLSPLPIPGPSSRTTSCSWSSTRRAPTIRYPAERCGAIPWRIAFSTSGWRIKCGTLASSTSGSALMATLRRSRKRTCSMSR